MRLRRDHLDEPELLRNPWPKARSLAQTQRVQGPVQVVQDFGVEGLGYKVIVVAFGWVSSYGPGFGLEIDLKC